MTTELIGSVVNDLESAIAHVEGLVNGNQQAEVLRHALKVSVSRVLGETALEHESLDECLRSALNDSRNRRVIMTLVLRALVIPSVVPHASERYVVELFESSFPDLYKPFNYNPKAQTFEKWSILTNTHERMAQECRRLLVGRGSLQEIEARKQEVLKGLAGKAIVEYCRIFGFEEVRAEAQTIFGLLSECLKADDVDLGSAISDMRHHLRAFIARHERSRNFLLDLYRSNFLSELARAVDEYDDQSIARFAADVACRMSTSELVTKRYPLQEPGRTVTVTVPFENVGPGAVLNLVAKISVDTDLAATNDSINFGDVGPGGFSLSFPILIISAASDLDVLIDLSWSTRAQSERAALHVPLRLASQDPGVDWKSLSRSDCYSTEVAEGAEFVGRKEKLITVVNRLTAARTQSTYITGQKRIGKTSLAYAIRDSLALNPVYSNYKVLYLEWGDYARMDAGDTVLALGQEISSFFAKDLSSGIALSPDEFRGTLAPLIRLAKLLLVEKPNNRYVVMLDEFDEIHPDMYRYGPLAEAVFSNLRTLSSQKNVAFVLIGGERMPFVISAQGDQLNKFVREGLDYFSRDEEWTDYQELVEGPTKNSLRWHPGAVNSVFEVTNGHPYYTKLVCSKIVRNAVADRDSDITRMEVDKATHAVVAGLDTNAFAHYWKDGIQADKQEEEAISLMRQRVLGGLARSIRDGKATLESISEHARTFGLAGHEVQPVLQELSRRGIVKESSGSYECSVPLFSQWLCEVGVSRLVVDTFGDQIADALRRAEEQAYVQSAELVALTANWDTYRGKRIGADEVRAWLEQVGTKKDQRLLFKLLQAVRFVSEAELRKFLRLAHGMVTVHVKPMVKSRKSDRRQDILVLYVDGEGKSGQYFASKYAEENDISAHSVMSGERFSEKAADYEVRTGAVVDAVVVVDDLIGTGRSLSENLEKFAADNSEFMKDRNAMLAVVALVATEKGEQRVRKTMRDFTFNADLRVCEHLAPGHYAFRAEAPLWQDASDFNRAKTLALEIGRRVYKKQPLGFGEEGLLLVFPSTCPNNSLPLLHSGSKTAHKWTPLFPRPLN